FRHAELSARALNEIAIGLRCFGDDFSRLDLPAVLRERLRFGAHHGEAEFLRVPRWQVDVLQKFFVSLAVGNAIVSDVAETLPTHDRSEMGRLSSSNRPLPEKNGWHGFQPWTSGKRDCAIGQTNSLPKRKSALGASNALDPAFVAICESDLGEAGVHIDKCAPSRPLILFSPIPERHCPHDEEVGSRTDLLKF